MALDDDRQRHNHDNDQFDFPVQPHDPLGYHHFAQMAIADPQHTHHLWLVDSGATNHYIAVKELLINYQDINAIPILTGRGYIYARGIGNLTMQLSIGPVTIQKVMSVPDLAGYASLLSVPQLANNECKIIFEADVCQIHREGYTLAIASFNGKAYYLDLATSTHTVMVTINSSIQPIGDRYQLSNYSWLTLDLPPPAKHHQLGSIQQSDTPSNLDNLAILHGSVDC